MAAENRPAYIYNTPLLAKLDAGLTAFSKSSMPREGRSLTRKGMKNG
jgi:hypothetical protein